ncbi:MAG TPA: hypothetical protein VGG24_08585, partial [Paraburkholderia sp.]
MTLHARLDAGQLAAAKRDAEIDRMDRLREQKRAKRGVQAPQRRARFACVMIELNMQRATELLGLRHLAQLLHGLRE